MLHYFLQTFAIPIQTMSLELISAREKRRTRGIMKKWTLKKALKHGLVLDTKDAEKGKSMSDSFPNKDWHLSVMPEEVLSHWHHKAGGLYVDGTLGGGGHSSMLLELDPQAHLLGVDRDPDALQRASNQLSPFNGRFSVQRGSYSSIDEALQRAGLPQKVDGILLDLGVNSSQLDTASRGFSFRFEGPLDMRFDNSEPDRRTAADIVNDFSERDLVRIFRDWGQEPRARSAARAILAFRKNQPFRTTLELRECLTPVLQNRKSKKKTDPVTLCFQALRIAVNEELQHLECFLDRFTNWLNPGGRIVILSFHSLEDRLVKHRFRHYENPCDCPPDFPVHVCTEAPSLKMLTRKPLSPTEEEIESNPRSRSTKLRAAFRIEGVKAR